MSTQRNGLFARIEILEREVDQTRNRVHNLRGDVAGIFMLIGRRGERIRELEKQVTDLATRDEIADAVAARLHDDGLAASDAQKARLTKWQTRGVWAAIFGACVGGVAEVLRIAGVIGN